MCLNKLYIKSNKLEFNPLIDRFFNYVPCGKCRECIDNIRNGYVLRLLNEFKNCTGSTFYYTLTYDEHNLPVYSGFPCFNKKQVQNFIKRFRKLFDCNLKYFLVSEYGDENKRPHYHLIVFLPVKISSVDFKRKLQKAWYFGSVYGGLNNGLVIDVRPFHYIVKYMCKDSSYLDYLDSKLDDDLISDFYLNGSELGYTFIPFHLQSTKIGYHLCDTISDNDLIRGFIVQTNSMGLVQKYPVPLYVYRHCLYTKYKNINGNVSYKLNFRGEKLLKSRLISQYNKYYETYESIKDKVIDKLLHSDSFLHDDVSNSIIKSNDLISNVVKYQILYKDYYFIPFKFKSFDEDINILIDCLSCSDDSKFLSEAFYFESTIFEEFIKIADSILQELKYNLFIQRAQDYNRNNKMLFYKTGKYKPIVIPTFDRFININSNCLCLITLNELRSLVD